MVIIIGALYVLVPAVLTLAMVLYASWCPVTIEEDSMPSNNVVYTQLIAVVERRAAMAGVAATYWEQQVKRAVDPQVRARAIVYAKTWGEQWRAMSDKVCEYRERCG